MPSILSLFAELGLKSDQFDKALDGSIGKMRTADAQLDKVISTSNKLGDTSATVARRYEKLNDGIALQAKRLIDASNAFQNGDINAKKFQTTIDSVSKSVDGLTSRIKDATARTTELSETGFTHFQNQIRGGVTGEQGGLFDLNRSRPIMGLGPLFQATGLRQYGIDEMTANVLLVAARQMGIIKTAAEGTAVASAAAAASETAFAGAAGTAVTSEAALAAESEAVAASSAASVASMTVFGVGLVPLVAVAAAIAGTFVTLKGAYDYLVESGHKRLEVETAIEKAINKQYLDIVNFNKERGKSQADRDFGRFAQTSDVNAIQAARENLLKQFKDNAEAVAREQDFRRNVVNSNFSAFSGKDPSTGKTAADQITYGEKYVNDAVPKGFDEAQQKLKDQIKTLDEQFDKIKHDRDLSSEQFYKNFDSNLQKQREAIKKADEQAAKSAEESAKKRAEAQKKLVDDAIKKANEYAEQVKQAKAAVIDTFSNTVGKDNPFVKIFDDGEKAIAKLRETFKGLNPQIEKMLEGLVKSRSAADAFALTLSNKLKASDFRDQARQFTQGYNDSTPAADATRRVNEILQSIAPRYISTTYRVRGSDKIFTGPSRAYSNLDPDKQREADQAIIAATQGIDPRTLGSDINDAAAQARLREADALDKQKDQALEVSRSILAAIKELSKAIQKDGILVTVKNESDRAQVTTRATTANTKAYYGN